MKQKAIICDIDGVLLDTKHIFEEIEKANLAGADKWEYFNRRANDYDVEIDSRVVDMLEVFANQGIKIIFTTARSSEIWKQTSAKIDMAIGNFAQQIFGYSLAMRGSNDFRMSQEVKQDLLNDIRNQYDVLFAIDDETPNCEMFKLNNILALQVHK